MPKADNLVPRLLLIDGHSLAYRAFYALPVESFAAPDGTPTNALHGFVLMLTQVVEQEKPTHIAVAFDHSRQTFRSDRFADYKAQRSASPEEFKAQLPILKELLEACGVATFTAPGFEADDIIATISHQATSKGFEVDVLTSDRDCFQLVRSNVTVLFPLKGVKDLGRFTPEKVLEKYGVTPEQYPDYAALRGDSSDNLPSVPGVGEKTAATWIQEYGSVENLLKNHEALKGKVATALMEHQDQVKLNLELNVLRLDVPIELHLENLLIQTGDTLQMKHIFDRLGFKQTRTKLLNIFAPDTEIAQTNTVAQHAIQKIVPVSVNDIKKLAANNATYVIAMIERENLVYVAMSDGRDAYIHVMSDNVDSTQEIITSLCSLENVVMYDAKPLMKWLLSQNLHLTPLRDLLLVSYIENPGTRLLELADAVRTYLNQDVQIDVNEGLFPDYSNVALRLLNPLIQLDNHLLQNVSAADAKILKDIDLPILSILAEIEHRGIQVDLQSLRQLETAFEGRMAEAAKVAEMEAGQTFNIASPKQLQEILFDVRKLPKTKKIKTGYTTDADALTQLFAETKDPVVEQILRWREVSKLKQVASSLIPLADAEGRIHTSFSSTTTSTGRLSSSDPNLQNIPIRTAEGRLIRACFVAGKGYDGLLTADYSQIEMRIMAHLADDPHLIAAFESGEDLHASVAAAIYGVPTSDVTADMRRRSKAMSYGLAYGLSAFGLSQQLGIDPSEASELMETYFSRFDKVREYLKGVVERARNDGYTETMFGRRRYLPDLLSDNRVVRQAAERMALNAPIQGTAADIIKIAMIHLEREISNLGTTSRLLLQVHDELVLEVVKEEKDLIEKTVREAMMNAATLKVPLSVSVGFGSDWDTAAH